MLQFKTTKIINGMVKIKHKISEANHVAKGTLSECTYLALCSKNVAPLKWGRRLELEDLNNNDNELSFEEQWSHLPETSPPCEELMSRSLADVSHGVEARSLQSFHAPSDAFRTLF